MLATLNYINSSLVFKHYLEVKKRSHDYTLHLNLIEHQKLVRQHCVRESCKILKNVKQYISLMT